MKMTDVSGFAQAAFDWLSTKGALPTLGVVAVLLWAMIRTGSMHLVTMRLWQLVIGKRKIVKSPICDFLDQRDALMRFRLQTGLRGVGTNKQVDRLIDWVNENDVDIDRVRACGDNFDLKMPGLKAKPPAFGWRLSALIAATLFFYAAVVLGVAIAVMPPLVQVVKTGHWYGVSEQRTFHFELGTKSPGFDANECANRTAVVAKTAYSVDDVSALCDLLASDKHQSYLRAARLTQWVPLGVGCLGAILFLRLFWGFLSQANAAIKLGNELQKSKNRCPPSVAC